VRASAARGGMHPAMLYAIRTSGADAVLCLGGVQGLAAISHAEHFEGHALTAEIRLGQLENTAS
jgi:hypothetical protein